MYSKVYLLDISLILIRIVFYLLVVRPNHQGVYCKFIYRYSMEYTDICILRCATGLYNLSRWLVLKLWTEELNANLSKLDERNLFMDNTYCEAKVSYIPELYLTFDMDHCITFLPFRSFISHVWCMWHVFNCDITFRTLIFVAVLYWVV
jgi:hypothetical protein